MDSGQLFLVYSRLILGACAAFLAIILWSKTRDMAWMLVVLGTIIAYMEIVCPILESSGVSVANSLLIGSIPLAAILLTTLRMALFIAALLIVVVRRYRQQ